MPYHVDIVGCADEGGASFANDGLRKLSPSYGPMSDAVTSHKTQATGLQTPSRFVSQNVDVGRLERRVRLLWVEIVVFVGVERLASCQPDPDA
ncbi:MAG: hypothetical protein NTX45_01120 [Proteobacteria bacterium]|nr:hypothetical protein [Pseudomonadota bacterium]